MGVPVFFKWLTMRNPKIIRDAVEATTEDFSSGNPVIDNFYIDMNGLIHPACNPKGENIKVPANFEEQCANIYDYIDKLMNIVRPKKTLYLAIDGVAPRAKMNQQRSRRFKAGLEIEEKCEKKIEMLERFKKIGAYNAEVESYATKKDFDSNMITPGTQFLCNVSNKIREYVKDRLENHKFWKNLIVVFSDANCPGEGEHKIMDYIRQERASSEYSPDQSHCIYGADADLIMLGLATHEPKFFIIREVVITMNDKFCTSCSQRGHFFMDCTKATSIEDEARIAQEHNAKSINVQFQFIRIQMVREFIHFNYAKSIIPFKFDLERIIDDFIFLCFFVGNDFLPHIPCLSIREGGIDVLMRVYEYCLALMPDYITKAGELNMKSLKVFVEEMTHYEESLVEEMIVREKNSKQREINNRNYQDKEKSKAKASENLKPKELDEEDYIDIRDPIGSFKEAMNRLNKEDPFNLDDYSVFGHNVYNFKEKYYREKFKITPGEFMELRNNVSRSYIEALKWICGYYYKGVPSWSWFYPFHYSPFFTDIFINEEGIPDFECGRPFKPFEQLMAVFPPRSCEALPKFLHFYMKDAQSPIIDYYPSNFHVDLVGKKFAWLGEVILPFIDDKRLLTAMGDYETKLNKEENYRNRLGNVNVYINKYGPLGRKINKETKLGVVMDLKWESGHDIEGNLKVITQDEDFIGFEFELPSGREHNVSLLEGPNSNANEEINEEFMSRTDKAAFGGDRYVRLIERIMFERKSKLRSRRNQHLSEEEQHEQEDKEDRRNNNYNRSRSHNDRERSRDKNRNYNNNNNNNHNSNNNNNNNNYNDYKQNKQYRHHDSRSDQRQEQRQEQRYDNNYNRNRNQNSYYQNPRHHQG